MIPDTVEIGGSLRGLSERHFFRLIARATEVLLPPLPQMQKKPFTGTHQKLPGICAHLWAL